MSGRKFKVLENNKKNFTKNEIEDRKVIQDKASDGLKSLQKSAPNHLNPIARYEYERVWEDLQTLPVKNLDRAVLEMYCTWYAIYREAEKDVKENGIFMEANYLEEITEKDGTKRKELITYTDKSKKNPSVSVMNDASSNIMRCASNLGLTVDSRMRIYTPPKEEKKQTLADLFG
ncbi:phage terminase small subunit P27 family [Carnobacterium antarcticum]|uniref:Phage terminase small subunit P27 family n=1 Tax=Carnobacterium antarcticum TaxID=2126436 RepID=A0ABW4NMH3_9LACT|nr:phage terminase small subunit P27 family [Carnobacterium sp. CP1]ALV21050.1 Phage terminase, small subunit [Carnobacterium sp. CP1]